MTENAAATATDESPSFDSLRPELDALVARYPERRAAMLPALWVLQRERGWLSPQSIREIADYLETPQAHVEGVITFYTMFKDRKVGQDVVMVCKTLSCRLRGAGEVLDAVREKLGVDAHGDTSDGRYSIEPAECLGLCDMAPCMLVGRERYGNLTPESAVRVLEERS